MVMGSKLDGLLPEARSAGHGDGVVLLLFLILE